MFQRRATKTTYNIKERQSDRHLGDWLFWPRAPGVLSPSPALCLVQPKYSIRLMWRQNASSRRLHSVDCWCLRNQQSTWIKFLGTLNCPGIRIIHIRIKREVPVLWLQMMTSCLLLLSLSHSHKHGITTPSTLVTEGAVGTHTCQTKEWQIIWVTQPRMFKVRPGGRNIPLSPPCRIVALSVSEGGRVKFLTRYP